MSGGMTAAGDKKIAGENFKFSPAIFLFLSFYGNSGFSETVVRTTVEMPQLFAAADVAIGFKICSTGRNSGTAA